MRTITTYLSEVQFAHLPNGDPATSFTYKISYEKLMMQKEFLNIDPLPVHPQQPFPFLLPLSACHLFHSFGELTQIRGDRLLWARPLWVPFYHNKVDSSEYQETDVQMCSCVLLYSVPRTFSS